VFGKIKKYVVGFFVLAGGILFAFLSGKSAGRRDEKLGKLDSEIKNVKKSLKEKEKNQNGLKKTLKSKKKALDEIKKTKRKAKSVGSKEAADFLKKYAKKKK
jgi:septal ring factor EnvC (AmiA/AmiB activator)